MTLTVGTNSYVSVNDADAYWLARNNSTWSDATTAQKEKALIEATQYLDGSYEFIGLHRGDETEYPLAWPRTSVEVDSGNFAGVFIDSDTVPQQIKDSQCELALEAISTRIEPSQDRGGAIKSVKVDVIEVEYFDWAISGKTFNFVNKILKPFIKSGKNNISLKRV